MTEIITPLPPLVTTARAAAFLGISRTALWRKINAGELDVVYTARRKRWIPARSLAPYEWTGGGLTRREFAELLGVSYSSVVRAVARDAIPVGEDQRVLEMWIAMMCDPAVYDAFENATFEDVWVG